MNFQKDREIIVTCAIGLRGHIACRILAQHGFSNVSNLTGGWKTMGCYLSDIKLAKEFKLEEVKNANRA